MASYCCSVRRSLLRAASFYELQFKRAAVVELPECRCRTPSQASTLSASVLGLGVHETVQLSR
jgi:hypothetical protein